MTIRYIEKILKRGGQHSVSLWIRNIQLAGFSLVFASAAVYSKDYDKVVEGGLLQGFTPLGMLHYQHD